MGITAAASLGDAGAMAGIVAPSSTKSRSDEALIARVAAGDKLAMHALFARHRLRVFHFVLRLVRDRALAEDVVSEVFLDVWRQAGRFEGRCKAETWLLTIARFKAISAMRRRPHETLAEDAADIADPGEAPDASIERKDRGDALRQCLARLSPAHREIIDLVYYHERSIDEVAQIVGIPASTVKTRMFHARKHLADQLSAAGLDRASL